MLKTLGKSESKQIVSQASWLCSCGLSSPASSLFCWRCGKSNHSGCSNIDEQTFIDVKTPQTGGLRRCRIQTAGADELLPPDVTTLMVGALPVRLDIHQLVEAINSFGFANSYDLVYMPYRSVKKRGKVQHGSPGYAFVNFKTPEVARKFASVFTGYTFPGFASERQALVKPAASQGYEANLALHANDKKQQGGILTFE